MKHCPQEPAPALRVATPHAAVAIGAAPAHRAPMHASVDARLLRLQRQHGNHFVAQAMQVSRATSQIHVLRQTESSHPDEAAAEDAAGRGASASCAEIIMHIEALIEVLAGRLHDLQQHGGGDAGHRQRFQIVQQTLRTLMTMALMACKNGEYDAELQEEAEKWVNKPLPAVSVQRETAWDRVARWAREVYEQGQDASEAARRFLHENPELVAVVVAAGVLAIAALLADDVTIVGIADDVLIPIIAALEWAALRMSMGF